MKNSLKRLYPAVAGLAFLGLVAASQGAWANQAGTADEAKAMLERAVVAVNADETAALAAFTAGTDGFKDRDLYVFCSADGIMTAHGANAALVGVETRTLVDKAGKNLGQAFIDVAKEGEINVVEYVWPRPGETEPVAKASYTTLVGEQICSVGYYQ